MSFHVGQLVVCVDDQPRGRLYPMDGLRSGVIYTVRDVLYDLMIDANLVWLDEIVRGVEPDWDSAREAPYWADRFRPVDETRIAVFRKIAANPKIEVDA